ncbi:MAG: integrase core domain-containing protein [Dehalococcoidia bacterium]
MRPAQPRQVVQTVRIRAEPRLELPERSRVVHTCARSRHPTSLTPVKWRARNRLTDQAHIESFFGHLKREWPHLVRIKDAAVLDTELARVRTLWNTVRLHEAIGYVTPDDEHHGRGPAIRRARTAGMKDARRGRIDYNRNHPPEHHT